MDVDQPTKSKEEYPYPIHKWNNEDNYKKVMNRHEWAWEFLRRNRSYQYDCDRYFNNDDFEEYKIIGDEYNRREILSYSDLYTKEDQDKDPLYRMNRDNFKFFLLKKYNIKSHFLYKPRLDYLITCFGISSVKSSISFVRYRNDIKKYQALLPENKNELVVKLRFDGSLDDQLSSIKSLFNRLNPHKNKIKERASSQLDFYKYIRVLDAVASGKDPLDDADEIARELVLYKFDNPTYRPDIDVKKWYEAGLKYTEEKYLFLLSSPT